MLSLRTTSPSARRGERQFVIDKSSSTSRAVPLSPLNRANLIIKPASAPKAKQAARHVLAPEHNIFLNEHEAPESRDSVKQDSSTKGTHSPTRFGVESPPPVHDNGQTLPGIPPLTTNSKQKESRLSGALSQYHQTMGNNASTMLRKSRSKLFREQADSPETTISDAAPSPPRIINRPSTISPFRFGTPRSSTVNFRKDEEASTLAGDPSPTRHSKLHKTLRLEETPVSKSQQAEASSTAFPSVSISAPTPDCKAIAQDSLQGSTRRVSNLALSPPLYAPTKSVSRPASGSSQTPSMFPTPFSQPQTPMPMPVPALTITHHECYQDHKKLFKLSNKHYTVPCMVCKVYSPENHWKCVWCYLWMCASCVESLRKIEGRSLSVLIEKVVKRKENEWKAMGGQGESVKSERAEEVESGKAKSKSPSDQNETTQRRRTASVSGR